MDRIALLGDVVHDPGRVASPDEAILPLRIAVIASGLAWGAAAIIIGPQLPFQDLTLLLVIFAGLVAGANATLVADRVSFHGFIAGALGPLALGVILNGRDRSHIIALVLLAMFAITMAGLHRRSHASLLDVLRTRAQLEMSERRAEHGRAFLDALLASAPNAIVWVDEDVRVTGINPSFDSLAKLYAR